MACQGLWTARSQHGAEEGAHAQDIRQLIISGGLTFKKEHIQGHMPRDAGA